MTHTFRAAMSLPLLAFAATPLAAQDAPDQAAVVETYANIAEAAYGDALSTARDLDAAIDAFLADPTEAGLEAARAAWRSARTPYMQTETYRFGNAIVDDWEGKVNAWPLDEGLIDYVDAGYFGSGENAQANLNVIATPSFELNGKTVDANVIDAALLTDTLHEMGENEANVATGYHAIEFLLWGQDLTSDGPGAGTRPHTDYLQGDGCTNGNCDRRAAYLATASDLLVDDLEWMAAQWTDGGAGREAVTKDPAAGVSAMLTGMGSLSFGELGGQRIKLGLMLRDPEEEHDCFSDNTPHSHYDDVLGVQNVWLGRYETVSGDVVEGAALRDLVAAADADLAQAFTTEVQASLDDLQAIKDAADAGRPYDLLLTSGEEADTALIQNAIDALVAQSRSIERMSGALDLSGVVVEGDDTLGDIFQ